MSVGSKSPPIHRLRRAARHAARVARAAEGATISRAHAAADCAFLSVAVVVSLMLYIGGLGFYYDDYSLLGRMYASHDQSVLGLYSAVKPAYGERPVAALVFATLYRVFGLDPLGYHVTNACVIVAVAILLYLVLRELRLPRVVAIAVPLVYSTVPHYATARLWAELVNENLSTAFYLASLYAGLRAVRAAKARAAWLAIVVLGVVGTLFTYEIVVPLFVLNVLLIWWTARRVLDGAQRRRAVVLTSGALIAALLAAGLAKVAGVAAHGQNSYELGLQSGVLHHLAYVVVGAIKLNVGTYFLALPYVLWWIVRHQFAAANAVVAATSGLLAFVYLWRVGRRDRDVFAASDTWLALIAVGVIAFILGYVVFLPTENVLFRSAGIDNRANAAAALGVAGVMIGAAGVLARRFGPRRSVVAFSAVTACAVASGVLVIQTLGSFWTAAADRQRAVVNGFMREAGPVSASTTVILDGVCPEIGPAIVFADVYDFRTALRFAYRDHSLYGDIASEAMRADSRGLSADGTVSRTYAYGHKLLVYDFTSGRLYHLPDQKRAAAYIARARPSFRCPPQRSFAWGFDPTRRWTLL